MRLRRLSLLARGCVRSTGSERMTAPFAKLEEMAA